MRDEILGHPSKSEEKRKPNRVWHVMLGWVRSERLRPILLALTSALLLVLATPAFDLWPLAFISLIPLYLEIREASPRRAAALGWLMGFVANLGGFSWGTTFLEEFAHLSGVVSLGLVVVLCAYQALTFLVWAWGSSLLVRRARLSWVFAAPLCIVLAEALVPMLFKYYLAITVWRAWPLIQVAELGGPLAVSALIVLVNVILGDTLLALSQQRVPGVAVRLGTLVFLVVLAGGFMRAAQVAALRASSPTLKVGLLQPNFGITSVQEREQHGEDYIQALRRATVELSNQGAELVIWSESAWPYLFDRTLTQEFPPGHPWELRPGAQGRLLAGMLTHQFGGADVYNSAVLFAENGQIAGRYDKNHLVPFGEYIPFAQTFPEWAKSMREQLSDRPNITPGSQPKVLIDGALRVGVVICYEDIDVAYTNDIGRQNPNLLVAIDSDAWFGGSAGPHQHLALSVFRAVELRRDFVRDTNTGVSAIVDALGRVNLEGPLFDVPPNQPLPATLLTGEVSLAETPAAGPHTIAYFPYACLLTLALGVFVSRSKRQRS